MSLKRRLDAKFQLSKVTKSDVISISNVRKNLHSVCTGLFHDLVWVYLRRSLSYRCDISDNGTKAPDAPPVKVSKSYVKGQGHNDTKFAKPYLGSNSVRNQAIDIKLVSY